MLPRFRPRHHQIPMPIRLRTNEHRRNLFILPNLRHLPHHFHPRLIPPPLPPSLIPPPTPPPLNRSSLPHTPPNITPITPPHAPSPIARPLISAATTSFHCCKTPNTCSTPAPSAPDPST